MLSCTPTISKFTIEIDSMRKSILVHRLQGAISEYKRVRHCEGYDYGELPDEIWEASLSEPFFLKENENGS